MKDRIVFGCHLILDGAAVIVTLLNPFLFLPDWPSGPWHLRAYFGLAVGFFVVTPPVLFWSRSGPAAARAARSPGRELYLYLSTLLLACAWVVLVVSTILVAFVTWLAFSGGTWVD